MHFLLEAIFYLFIYLSIYLSIYLFIYWQRWREGEREGEKHQCVFASYAPPTGDLAHNPGMCPDWESNWRPFGLQAHTQSTELHQPGLEAIFLKFLLNLLGWHWLTKLYRFQVYNFIIHHLSIAISPKYNFFLSYLPVKTYPFLMTRPVPLFQWNMVPEYSSPIGFFIDHSGHFQWSLLWTLTTGVIYNAHHLLCMFPWTYILLHMCYTYG